MILTFLFWFNLLMGYQDSSISRLRNYYDLLSTKTTVELHSDKDFGIYYDGIEYIDGILLHQYTVVY